MNKSDKVSLKEIGKRSPSLYWFRNQVSQYTLCENYIFYAEPPSVRAEFGIVITFEL